MSVDRMRARRAARRREQAREYAGLALAAFVLLGGAFSCGPIDDTTAATLTPTTAVITPESNGETR